MGSADAVRCGRSVAGPGRHPSCRRRRATRTSIDGCSRRRSCTPTGTALDIAVKDGGIVGVRGRAGDRVNHGRLGPKDLFGWQANQSPDRLRPDRLVRMRCRARRDRLGYGDGPHRGALASAARRAGRVGPFGFYTSGQLFLEEYYTLAVIGKAGIGTPHMDGNTRLCTATAGGRAEGQLRHRRAARVLHRRRPLRRPRPVGPQRAPRPQTVLWMRMLDRRHGPNPPAMLAVDPRATPVAREADVHLAVRNGTNVALMNGLLRELLAPRLDRRAVRRRSHHRLRVSWRPLSSRTRRSGSPRSAASPRASVTAAAELLGTCEPAGQHRAPGLLPVEPGDRRGLPGQQHPPDARHDRTPGAGCSR